MNIFKKLYKLYTRHLADILLIGIIFTLIFLTQYIPYINIFVVNFDPALTGIVVAWIIFYFMVKPSTTKIIMWSLFIFLISYIFLLFNQLKGGEIISSLTYVMIFTAVILEIRRLKKIWTKILHSQK